MEVHGLSPDRWYWYRFCAGDATSPVGRTRTFPASDVLPSRLRFAVTSCQNYEQGLYTAYEQMARDDLDLVCHLGDYIYEYAAGLNGKVRTHAGSEIESLADYRIRHAQYRSDMTLYRHAGFGRLADFYVLDTRQYRGDQPNGDKKSPINDEAKNTARTILGREQRNWLARQLITSRSRWNVLAQQVMMAEVGFRKDGGEASFSMDQWPGYAAEREAVLGFLADRRISNPVVLTGDIHSAWANELRVDDLRHDGPVIATEFVATSLSSGGNGPEKPAGLDQILTDNPCVRFHNGERGYIRCIVGPDVWRSDYMVVGDVLEPGGKTFARASFVVESGDPRLQPA